MKKTKKKNAITLLALVITIIILLLLAGVAIQMSFGENGLIVKSVQAQKEQAKAELYDTAKLSYANLNAKALENGQPSPQVELALSTTEFRGRYDIVGDDITDKKATIIDTKDNVLNMLKTNFVLSEGTEETAQEEEIISWPKTVAGVTIPEEDKDKMIVKIRVPGAKVKFDPIGYWNGKVDYGEGLRDANQPIELNRGEHVIKISDIDAVTIRSENREDFELEILQWKEAKYMELTNVTQIYEPEPDGLQVYYVRGKFTEIPEWLFSKKKKTKLVSMFYQCNGITSIPEDLFKYQVNAEKFENIFQSCKNITTIPENLFKYNTKATSFSRAFWECTSLTTIPENLFKYNSEVIDFEMTFAYCYSLRNIPENLFAYNVNAENFSWIFPYCKNITIVPENLFKNNTKAKNFSWAFSSCENLKTIYGDLFRYNSDANEFALIFSSCYNLESIPENLFKYNTKIEKFGNIFANCRKITTIPENLFKYNTNVITFEKVFSGCEKVETIPENLFKYNTEVIEFRGTFSGCKSIKTIPENLFKHNLKVKYFSEVFSWCEKLERIPDEIIEFAKQVKQRGGDVTGIFDRCTSASNYNSLPSYMK